MMQRVRVQVEKGPPARFVSHLDFQRLLGRALRRGRLPVAMSEGFNPHPRIAFGSALAVGATSDAEYVDFDLSAKMEPEEFARALNTQLPKGFRVVRAGVVPLAGPGLMAVLDTAAYRLGLDFSPGSEQPVPAEIQAALNDFLRRSEIRLLKEGKSGLKEVDIRPLIYDISLLPDGGAVCFLQVLLAAGSRGSLRPEDLCRALMASEPLFAPARLVMVHRTGLFRFCSGGLQTPWDFVQ